MVMPRSKDGNTVAAAGAEMEEGRRRRLDGLAGLREGIPNVRFAGRIQGVTRDARAAAARSRRSPAIVTIPRPQTAEYFCTGIMHQESPAISMAKFWFRIR
jgi:hypothetical protein